MKQDDLTTWKNEIIETEKDFAKTVLKEGVASAFLKYAAEDAVLIRNNNLIIGKASLQDFYKNSNSEQGSLTWKPDFVDVSNSGDLGYTYGKYQYTATDSLGNTNTSEGVFHTVWKKQSNGKWKFVWD